jgi:aspartyl-tRNA(Asn)/glutamyl-tRNA(Gln) amidotransferase subunit A
LTASIKLAGQLAGITPAGDPRIKLIDLDALDWTALRRAALLMVEREGAAVHAALLADPRSAISPGLRKALTFGRDADEQRLGNAREQLEYFRKSIEAWFEKADVVALPTTPQAAFAFHLPAPENQADYTVPASVLGLPAISVPRAGGPGVQLVGRRGADALLLAAALNVI